MGEAEQGRLAHGVQDVQGRPPKKKYKPTDSGCYRKKKTPQTLRGYATPEEALAHTYRDVYEFVHRGLKMRTESSSSQQQRHLRDQRAAAFQLRRDPDAALQAEVELDQKKTREAREALVVATYARMSTLRDHSSWAWRTSTSSRWRKSGNLSVPGETNCTACPPMRARRFRRRRRVLAAPALAQTTTTPPPAAAAPVLAQTTTKPPPAAAAAAALEQTTTTPPPAAAVMAPLHLAQATEGRPQWHRWSKPRWFQSSAAVAMAALRT